MRQLSMANELKANLIALTQCTNIMTFDLMLVSSKVNMGVLNILSSCRCEHKIYIFIPDEHMKAGLFLNVSSAHACLDAGQVYLDHHRLWVYIVRWIFGFMKKYHMIKGGIVERFFPN